MASGRHLTSQRLPQRQDHILWREDDLHQPSGVGFEGMAFLGVKAVQIICSKELRLPMANAQLGDVRRDSERRE